MVTQKESKKDDQSLQLAEMKREVVDLQSKVKLGK